MKRLAALALTAGAFLAVAAPPASAHTTLRSTDPKADSSGAAPTSITLTYNDPVMVPRVVLTGPDGARHEQGAAQATDNKVVQAVKPGLPGGRYTVGWRVVASDGHPITGRFTFTVEAADTPPAAPAAPAPSASPAASTEGSSRTGWLWLGGAAAALAVAAGGALLLRRSRTS
ncbi:copper resistance CopC family protein [Actinomadura flavalba]|uniref:copper resistance CopC family protein n=1 Tax=Actinomadura flavalba TaxID=1120938 RepID=UPI00035FFA1E|nr:copper resistance CopC family protein [Actinomadura flavalba]